MVMTYSLRDAKAERLVYSKPTVRSSTAAAESVVHEDIHPGVYIAFVGCWAALIAVFVSTFAESPFTLFMLAVVIGYSIMFFGVPYVMSRVAPPQTRVGDVPFFAFLRGQVETLTGPVSGMEALTQVIMVPLALTLGGMAIGFIVHFEADHIHMLYIGQGAAYPR